MKKFRILLLSSLIIFIISLCQTAVFATGFDDIESEEESLAVSSEEASSQYIEESSVPEPEQPQTEPYAEPETEYVYSQAESSQAVADTSSAENDQTVSSENDDRSLPQIDTSKLQTPTAVGSGVGKSETGMAAGVVSWLCVGVGVAVICGILVSSRTGKRK